MHLVRLPYCVAPSASIPHVMLPSSFVLALANTTMPDLFSLASEAVLVTGTICARAIIGTSYILLIQRDRHNATSYNEVLALSPDPRANFVEAALSNGDVSKTGSSIAYSSNCMPSQHSPRSDHYSRVFTDTIGPIISTGASSERLLSMAG